MKLGMSAPRGYADLFPLVLNAAGVTKLPAQIRDLQHFSFNRGLSTSTLFDFRFDIDYVVQDAHI